VLVGSCAGDSGEERTSIPLDAWVRAVDKVCASTAARAAVASDADPFDPDLTGRRLRSATTTLSSLVDGLEEAVVDFAAIDDPNERTDDAREFVEVNEAAIDQLRTAVSAGEDGDLEAFKDAVEAGASDLDEARELAADLGLEDCAGAEGAPASTTVPPTTGPAGIPGV
jgi:hypothetical protein